MKKKQKTNFYETKLFEDLTTHKTMYNNIFFVIFMTFALFIFSSIPAIILSEAIVGGINGIAKEQLAENYRELIENFIFVVMPIIAVIIFIKIVPKNEHSLKSAGINVPKKLVKYSYGFVLGILLPTIIILIGLITGFVTLESFKITPTIILWTIMTLIFFVVQGASEEVLVRGYLLPPITKRYGVIVGIIISALFFSVLHLANPNFAVFAFINIALFGVLTAIYMYKDMSIWSVFAIHSAWNWMLGPVLGIEVSGLNLFSEHTMFKFNITGPDWLFGGNFGLEGGFLATLILTITTIPAIYLLLKKYEFKKIKYENDMTFQTVQSEHEST